jgi:hypothetical protein
MTSDALGGELDPEFERIVLDLLERYQRNRHRSNLSAQRAADALRRYLLAHGIDPEESDEAPNVIRPLGSEAPE